MAMTEEKKKKTTTRIKLDREFWERYHETDRRLRERIEYHKRRAAEERAAREDAAKGEAA